MNWFKIILIASCCFSNHHSFCQTNNDYSTIIRGSWIVLGSVSKVEIESPQLSSYSKYEFHDEQIMYAASNEFERGVRSNYSVTGNILQMFDRQYSIQNYNDKEQTLVFIYALKFPSKTLDNTVTFVRKERYDSLWKFNNPTRLAVQQTKPVFKGNLYLHDFIFSNSTTFAEFEKELMYQQTPVPPKKDIYLRIKMSVDSTGEVIVKEVITEPGLGKRRVEQIKQKLENTSGYWMPSMQGGVNKAVSLNLVFVKRGQSSLDFMNRSSGFYSRALEAFKKEKYELAMHFINKAINLDPKRFEFYLMRASCYLQMDQVDKYCKDVVQAYYLNPLVKLTNSIIVDGEGVEISCGGK
jgi:hypothetical protein